MGPCDWSADDIREWVAGGCLAAGVRRPELFQEFDEGDGLPRSAA